LANLPEYEGLGLLMWAVETMLRQILYFGKAKGEGFQAIGARIFQKKTPSSS